MGKRLGWDERQEVVARKVWEGAQERWRRHPAWQGREEDMRRGRRLGLKATRKVLEETTPEERARCVELYEESGKIWKAALGMGWVMDMAYVVIADWKGIRGHSGVRPKKGESELLEEILGKRKGTVEDRLGRVRNRLLAELEKRTATPQARASLGVVELERYFRLVTDALRAERDPRGGEETPMEVVTWLDAGSVGGNEG